MIQTPIIVFIRLSNKAARTLSTFTAELFVTTANVTKSSIIDVIGILDSIFSNQALSSTYSIKS